MLLFSIVGTIHGDLKRSKSRTRKFYLVLPFTSGAIATSFAFGAIKDVTFSLEAAMHYKYLCTVEYDLFEADDYPE